MDDPTYPEERHAIGRTFDGSNALLDQENRDAGPGELAQGRADPLQDGWGQAFRWFIPNVRRCGRAELTTVVRIRLAEIRRVSLGYPAQAPNVSRLGIRL